MADTLTWAAEAGDVGAALAALDRLRNHTENTATWTAIASLVVVAHEPDDAEQIWALIHELPAQPGRSVVIVPARDGDDALLAQVRLHISSEDARTVWSEDVCLHLGTEAMGHLPSVVEPLLFSDLPVVLWYWDAIPEVDAPELAIADLIVYESASEPNALRQATAISRRYDVVDLAWIRLGTARRLLAAAFDHPHWTAVLSQSPTIEVSGAPPDAALLDGWLRSRLNRETSTVEGAHLRVSLGAGSNAVDLEATDGEITVTASRAHGEPLTLKGSEPNRPELLSHALASMTPDPLYAEALAALGTHPS